MRTALLVLLCTLPMAGCKLSSGNTPAEKRHFIDEEATKTLNELAAADAGLRQKVDEAPGYAVFSQRGVKIFLAGSENGYGVVIDNKTKKRTYMRMAGLDLGPGIGLKDYRAVFVFRDAQVLANFVESGWEVGGQAEAAAKYNDKGESAHAQASGMGITIYRVTDAGIALQATVGADKYWKDEDLN